MESVTIRTYQIGFVLSVLLTLISFGSLAMHIRSGHVFPTHMELTIIFLAAAILQLIAQLIFFLHVHKDKTGWSGVALGFALFIVAVIVGGSLWIMAHLQHENMGNVFNGAVTPQNEQD